MNTSTLRFAAALLGALILSVTLGGQPALAKARCPCLTGDLVDGWFRNLPLSVDRPGQVLACVDDPGFTTFDYVERSVSRSLLIDVTYATSRKRARCLVDPSHEVNALTESWLEITNDQAEACREEILDSRVWSFLGCPNN